MSTITMIVTTDFNSLKIASLSFDVLEDKARAKIFYTRQNKIVFDITMWMWQLSGKWNFGWSLTKMTNVSTTTQLEEKLKLELQKVLLPFYEGKSLLPWENKS